MTAISRPTFCALSLATLAALQLAGCGGGDGGKKNTRGGIASNEETAIRGLMAISNFQIMYRRNDWEKSGTLKFARPYTLLRTAKDGSGQPIDLIPAELAAAAGKDGKARCGYLYADITKFGPNVPAGTGTPGQLPPPPPPPGSAGQNNIEPTLDFAVCATPAKYGQDGKRTFIVSSSGEVYGKDLGKSEFVDQMPPNPAAAGWTLAELPGLKLAKNESQAAARLQTYCMAQDQFLIVKGSGAKRQFAVPYTQLNSAKSAAGKPLELIAEAIVAAAGKSGKPLDGYLFADVPRVGGKAVDPATGYALCATPATYGEGSKLTLVVTQNGQVLAKDLGKAEFVQDLPSDPGADGWVMLLM